MNKKHILTTLLVLFLLGDFVFSFIQYYQTPLFGDIASHVLPDQHIQKIFDDPLGFNVVQSGEKHANPNRFFAHYFYSEYFKKIPLFLQNFVTPINSVYLSCALAKIAIQILFVFLLASLISGEKQIYHPNFLLSAALVAPLFQAYGYWSRMGINDKSIAYTFFYAVPLIFLLLFLLPIFKELLRETRFKPRNYILLLPFVIILPLSGPLIPAIIAILLVLLVCYFWIKSKNPIQNRIRTFIEVLPMWFYVLLIPLGIVTVYSLFLGFFNSQDQGKIVPLATRYVYLLEGIWSQIIHSFGFPLMLSVIGVNIYLLKRTHTEKSKKLVNIIFWIGLFAVIYILLLPLGGYKTYRPRIIRHDTIMPVTVALIYIFVASTYFLINHLKEIRQARYSIVIVACLLIYTVADLKGLGRNKCEKQAFEKMANSLEKIVPIPKDCFVMDWDNIHDYKRTEKQAEMIYFWGITSEKKLFYNEQ